MYVSFGKKDFFLLLFCVGIISSWQLHKTLIKNTVMPLLEIKTPIEGKDQMHTTNN